MTPELERLLQGAAGGMGSVALTTLVWKIYSRWQQHRETDHKSSFDDRRARAGEAAMIMADQARRISELEERVDVLQRENADLRQQVGTLTESTAWLRKMCVPNGGGAGGVTPAP